MEVSATSITRSKRHAWAYWLSLIIIAILVCVPFLTLNKLYNQDDFLFHKARMLAYYTAVVQQHTVMPRVLGDMAGHFGYAADIFYSDLPLLPFVALKAWLGGFVLPYQLYLVGVSVATALVAYACAKQVAKPHAAWLASVVYTANTYRLIDVYVRGALGEALAFVVLPIVALGVYRSLQQQGRWRMLASGMSLVLIMHPMTAGICVVLLAALDGYLIIKRRFSQAALICQAKAAAAAIGLTLFLTAPMLEQLAAQPLVVAGPKTLWGVGLNYTFGQLLSNSLSNAAGVWAHLAPNSGPLALAVMGMSVLAWSKLTGAYRVIAAATISLFVLSSNLIGWALVAHTSLATIQFEWRLLMFVALGVSVLSMPLANKHWRGIAVLAVLLAVTFNVSVRDHFAATTNILVVTDKNAATTAPEAIGGGYEFLPTTVSPTIATDPHEKTIRAAAKGHPLIGIGTRVSQHSSGRVAYTITRVGDGKGVIVLPKLYYPGYKIAGQRVINVNGLVGIRSTGKVKALVHLQYVGTWSQHLSVFGSLITLAFIAVSWWRNRRI